jgi:hypothetical protein
MNPHADRAPRSLLRCSTRTICFLALLVPVCAVVFPPPVFSQQKMDVPRLHARAETYLQFFYNAPTDAYNVDIPLYTTVSLSYESSRVASLFSIDYATELTLGETYVRGGTEYSSMQIGYSVVDWGVGYSLSPLGEVNPFDSRYPDNIFYRTHYAPYPGFITTFGNSGFYNQLFIGKIDESRQSLDSTDFGIRGVVKSGESTISGGFIRKLGIPPPLFFLTAVNNLEREDVWLELTWEYNRESRDVWTFLIGMKQRLPRSTVYAELIADRSDNFLFLQEILQLNSDRQLSVRTFFHLPEWSSAVNGYAALALNKTFTLKPGFYLFIGREESYFSPLRVQNDNSLYLMFDFEF